MKINRKALLAGLLILLLLQLFSRWGSLPTLDYVLDDWSYLSWGEEYPSYRAIWHRAAFEPDRPIYAGIVISLFKWVGDDPVVFQGLSIFSYSLFLALGCLFVWLLTGQSMAVLIWGWGMAILPHLSSNFHWPVIIAFSFVYSMYLISAICWVQYVRQQRIMLLWASALMYGISLFIYELGAGLPAAFFLLAVRSNPRKAFRAMIPFVGCLGVYALWRFTSVFGMGERMLYGSENVVFDFTLGALYWNATEIVRWWIGSHFFRTLANGYAGFLSLSSNMQWWIIAGTMVFCALMSLYGLRGDASRWREAESTFSFGDVMLFATGWFFVTSLPGLLLYTAARILIVPAIGLMLMATVVAIKMPRIAVVSVMGLLTFLWIPVNAGTAYQFEVSGRFNRKLYMYLEQNLSALSDVRYVLLDSTGMRPPVAVRWNGGSTVYDAPFAYGNAGWIRGYAPVSMLKRIFGHEEQMPVVLLDREHRVQRTQDGIEWADRFSYERTHSAKSNAVLVLRLMDQFAP